MNVDKKNPGAGTPPSAWPRRAGPGLLAVAVALAAAAGALGLAPGSGGGLLPAARALDPAVRQLVVAVAPDWDAVEGRAQRYEREAGGPWRPVGAAWPVLFGKNGLAWGRGVPGYGDQEPGRHKQERDGRAPAGLFRIGRIYTYDPVLPAGSDYPHHQVSAADAWVDDPRLPNYNRFVTIPDPAHPPAWFEKMKMRHGDFAYRWLVEIRHNADPPVAGDGSAIFFHLRRGATRPTSGCTTMAEPRLVELIRWLRAEARPHYALLPRAEYERRWREWGLPEPGGLAAGAEDPVGAARSGTARSLAGAGAGAPPAR